HGAAGLHALTPLSLTLRTWNSLPGRLRKRRSARSWFFPGSDNARQLRVDATRFMPAPVRSFRPIQKTAIFGSFERITEVPRIDNENPLRPAMRAASLVAVALANSNRGNDEHNQR